MTPMADVMIVLLIIFMVATPIIARAPVKLPDASHLTEHKGERLEIVLRREGGVEIDGTSLASISASWRGSPPAKTVAATDGAVIRLGPCMAPPCSGSSR